MSRDSILGLLAAVGLLLAAVSSAAVTETGGLRVIIRDFVPYQGICRAGRPIVLSAYVENTGETAVDAKPELVLPEGIRVLKSDAPAQMRLGDGETRKLSWSIQADKPGDYPLKLKVDCGGAESVTAAFDLRFIEPMPIKKLDYVPEPEPVKTSILVGAHNCPLWEKDKFSLWAQIRKHPERTPALGFYAQESPEVADWETKWAVEHGISFFIYCWYRASQDQPVKMKFGSAIHDALFNSRFRNKMKYTIMWTNHQPGVTGVSDLDDLRNNLIPFWMENYFKDPNYLKIDNKPVFFVYEPLNVMKDLGSMEKVREAFDIIRQACVDAGFDGVHILGECRAVDLRHSNYLKQTGIQYTFAYVWPCEDSPPPERAVEIQMEKIRWTQEAGVMPQVVTVSQAWSGWHDDKSVWKIPPKQYEGLLRQAKDFIGTLPENELGSRMILLDCWNEWGEGHYIAPYREYGFGYLDAVRKVFSDAPTEHVDLTPDDIGLGPYDRAYTAFKQEQEKLHRLATKKALKKGADEPGLVAWWAFDESKDAVEVLDYSGHRLGGKVSKASRTRGLDGNALDCRGGCAVIASSPLLSPTNAMTLECWVRTELPDQTDKWLVNRIQGERTNSGYRLGLNEGRPCFAVPQTEWSHQVTASKLLPLGRWVHLAGTFDGNAMRIYIDGEECGSLDRPGPANTNDFEVYLGSYAENHKAHFTGLLDEVKLYNRALSADELRAHAGRSKASQ